MFEPTPNQTANAARQEHQAGKRAYTIRPAVESYVQRTPCLCGTNLPVETLPNPNMKKAMPEVLI